jgi:hypothetical protein
VAVDGDDAVVLIANEPVGVAGGFLEGAKGVVFVLQVDQVQAVSSDPLQAAVARFGVDGKVKRAPAAPVFSFPASRLILLALIKALVQLGLQPPPFEKR